MTRPQHRVGRAPSAPAPPARPHRVAVAAVLATAALGAGLLAGCGGEATGAESGTALRVVIPDAHIREPASPCSGAHGFRFAHAQAPYAVQDPTGREIATGVLPEGTAEQAFTMDLGQARQPTVCVMMLDVPGVETLDGHRLVIDERAPLPIRPNQSLDGLAEVVLR